MKEPVKRATNHDIVIGARVRTARTLRNWSQTKLALALGITFQQIQKYEKGTNRISAARLLQIAELLSMPVMYFFEDIDLASKQLDGKREPTIEALAADRMALKAAMMFKLITNQRSRIVMLAMIRNALSLEKRSGA